MGHVLQNWRGGDWKASQIYAYCEVVASAWEHIKLALWLFRGLYIGVELPLTAQGQSVWDVVPSTPDRNSPGSWGGHAVNVIAISPDESIEFISWGARMRMTRAFWDAYVDEVYAVVTHDLAAPDSVLAANGFNLQQLEADLAELGG
jgi:hypothetical protein